MTPITVQEAAVLARVTPDAIRKRVQCGEIPDRRPPGKRHKKIILFREDVIRDEPIYDDAA